MVPTHQEEKSRVDALLASGSISADDHRTLLDTLEGRRPKSGGYVSWLTSPYRNLSVPVAMLVGFCATVLLSLVAVRLNLYFPGALDFQFNLEPGRTFSLARLLVQNLMNILVPAVVFFAASYLARQKNLRLVDFVASISLVRVPLLLFALCLLMLAPLLPDLLPTAESIAVTTPQITVSKIVMILLALGFLVWEVTLFFSAVKESSGLKEKCLWVVFVAGLLVAETISYTLNTFLVF